MSNIILASGSPRRRELLAGMGLDFEVVPSEYEEKLDDTRSPEEVAIQLAIGKAMQVAERYPEHVVIGSDLIVSVDGHQLEKPRDKAEAYAILEMLCGRENEVTTSVVVISLSENIQLKAVDKTIVYFKQYNKEVVTTYVESGDPLDKAGAYGIQSGAAPLIDRIEGEYDTVIGLPTRKLAELLSLIGISASPVELTPPVPQKL